MMPNVSQIVRRMEAGEYVRPEDGRLAVAALHHAYLELADGVTKALDKCGVDEWALTRLGGYLYESDLILRDPVALYAPAGDALAAFLRREKTSEGTA